MNPKARIPAIAAISFLNLLPAADAAPQTWVGLGTNGNWATPGNFTPGGVDTGSEVIFTGSNYLTNNFKDLGSRSYRSLAFALGAGAFVLRGGFETGFGMTNQSSNLQTLNDNVSVRRSQTWDAGSSGLRFAGPVQFDVAISDVALTLTGIGNTAIEGNVSEIGAILGSGSANLVKQGSGTLFLTGSNSYRGGTTMAAGTVQVSQNANLGSTNGTLTFNGGTLRTTAGFTMDRATTINSSGGTFDVASGNLTQQGDITGTGNLLKQGTGTLTLTGSNSYSGSTIVRAGTLAIDGGGSINQPPDFTVAQLPGDTATAVLSNGSATTGFIFIASNIGATGTIQMNGGTWNNTNQTQVGSSGAGTFNLAGGTFLDVAAGIGVFANSVGVANVSGGAWTNSTDIIVGAGGSGTLNISAGTVSSPLLRVAGSAGSTGAINLNGGVLLAGSVTEGDGSGTVTFGGGTLRLRTNQATLFSGFEAGDIILTNGGGTIDSQAFNVATAVGLTGNGGLTKQGTGTLSLTGSNNYTGATDVRAGTLIVNSGSINHTNAAMTVGKSNGDTATLVISNGGRVVSGSGLVGDAAGSTGSVSVRSGTWANLGTLTIGESGAGSMTINGGGVSNTTGTIGGSAGSTSSVTVTSGGWTNSGNLKIGGSGTGSLLINGGFVTNANALLGEDPSGVGRATVTSGSWSNNFFAVGYAGAGTLEVGGGTVDAVLVRIGELSNGVGRATVSGGTLQSSFGMLVGEGGTGTLNLVGAGTVTADAGTGTVTVAQNAGSTGTPNIGTNGAAGTLNAALVEGGAGTAVLNFNHTNNLTFTSRITGGIQLNKLGSGTTTLTRSNTYSGATAIEAGALIVNGALGGTNTVTVKNGATLGGTGSVAGAVTVEGGGILAPGASAGTFSLGSLILNSSSALKFELGTTSDLVVVAGDLTLDGLLDVTALSGFGAGSYNLFQYSGALTNNGLTLGTMPSGFFYGIDLSTTNYVRLTVAPPDLYWDGPNTTPNGTVNGGTGTWNNTSSNWTSVNGLTNYVWNDGSTAYFTATAGTVTVGENVSVAEMIFQTSGYVLTGLGQIAIKGATLAVDTATNVVAEIGAAITGTGTLEKTGAGTLTLTASNSYTGVTTIRDGTVAVTGGGSINHTISDLHVGGDPGSEAILKISTNGYLANASSFVGHGTGSSGTANVSGGVWSNSGVLFIGYGGSGTVNLTGGDIIAAASNIGAFADGTANVSGGTWSNTGMLIVGGFASGTLNLTNGTVSASEVTLGGAPGSSGQLNLFGGTLLAGQVTRGLGTGKVTLDGGTLRLNTNQSDLFSGFSNGDVVLTNGGGTIDTDTFNVATALGLTGSGSFTKQGTGTLTLTGNNSYTGGTTITAGTLQVGNGGTTGSITGNVTNNGALIFNRSDAVTFSNAISGGGSLAKLGASTLTLTGSNSYTGGTAITAGTLQVGTGGTAGSITGDITNNGALIFNRSDAVTFSNAISGSGSLAKLGASTLTLTGSNSYTGGTAITAGTLQIGTGGTSGSITGDVTNNGALVFDRAGQLTLSNVISGSGSLAKLGAGTLALTAANSYAGGTVLSSGTLLVGDDLSLGSGAFQIGGGTTFGVVSGENVGLSNAVTLLGNVDIAVDVLSALDFEGTVDLGAASRTITFTEDESSVCFLGAISGAGGLSFVMGAPGLSGEVTFCGPGDNTYAGLTRVGSGVELGLEKDPGAIAIAGDLLIDAGGSVTLVDSSEQINPA